MSKYSCKGCPSSCSIVVEEKDGEYEITGANCQKGKDLAVEEHNNPYTKFSGMVRVAGLAPKNLYVASDGEVPKNKVEDIKNKLSEMTVTLPVQRGEIILADACGTGVDIISTRAMLY